VFAVTGGVLRTPDTDGRILAGIGRDHVLTAARGAGLPVRPGPLRLAELASASEAFVVSALRGVLPVVALDDPAARWDPGPVTASLGASAGPAAQAGNGSIRSAAPPARVPWPVP